LPTRTVRRGAAAQILHVDDFCNECDNCQTFCVHHGKPYVDKPRLFLDPELFAAERTMRSLSTGARFSGAKQARPAASQWMTPASRR